MPGVLICAAAIVAHGIRAALTAVMPELEYQIYRGEIGSDVEAFARFASAQHPQMTIFDADSVRVREVLEALGERVLAPLKAQPGEREHGLLGKMVVLTTRPDAEDLFVLAKYRATAYLSGCLPVDELVATVQRLLTEDLYLLDSRTFADPQLAALSRQRLQQERVVDAWQEAVPTVPEDGSEQPLLTELELRLLRALSCGMDTRVAAKHVGVSYFKAKTLIPALEHKLQVGNRTGAVMRAWQLGLVPLPDDETLFHYAGGFPLQASALKECVSGVAGLEQRRAATVGTAFS